MHLFIWNWRTARERDRGVAPCRGRGRWRHQSVVQKEEQPAQQQGETITPTREKRWCQRTSSAWGIGCQIWLFLLATQRSPSTQGRNQFWFWKLLLTCQPWSHLWWCGTSPAAQTERKREEGTESAVGSVEIEQQPKNNSTPLSSGFNRAEKRQILAGDNLTSTSWLGAKL